MSATRDKAIDALTRLKPGDRVAAAEFVNLLVTAAAEEAGAQLREQMVGRLRKLVENVDKILELTEPDDG